jgi:hypothetical protein
VGVSTDGRSTEGVPSDTRITGLRCGRFAGDPPMFLEAFHEIVNRRPLGAPLPADYARSVRRVPSSLRFR